MMSKIIPTTPNLTNIAKVIELLTDTPLKIRALSSSLKQEQLTRPLGGGKRSFVENLAHLINCEARSAEAIYLALMKDEPLLPDIHPEKDWGKLARFDLLESTELLAYFTIRRKVLLRILGGLKEKDWERCIRENGKQRRESVYWRARSIALHEAEHLDDMEKKLKLLM